MYWKTERGWHSTWQPFSTCNITKQKNSLHNFSQKLIKKLIELEINDIIEEGQCCSTWISSLLIVPKHNSDICWCHCFMVHVLVQWLSILHNFIWKNLNWGSSQVQILIWPNPHLPADLVTFTEEIFNGKLHFLCSAITRLCKGSAILSLLLTILYKK